jgi:Bacterial PH domain
MTTPDEPDPAPWAAAGIPAREALNLSAGVPDREPETVETRPARPVPRAVQRHLMSRETSVVCVRHHWAAALWPMVAAAGATVAAVWMGWRGSNPAAVAGLRVGWLLWLAVMLWAGNKIMAWRRWWFVITGVRVLDVRSWTRVHVEPMPLKRLADLRYDQSLWGRLLGYGTLHCASFATDHALHLVRFLPRSDMLEREISMLMYPPEQTVPLTTRLLQAVDTEGELR